MKTRFCPSPTGQMHLGNVRTALFNALLAKSQAGGELLLRIEDTDQARSSEEFSDNLQHDLQWLGIAWQEGPGVGGELGPYWQSQRQAIYDEYYQYLEAKDLAYPCFCTEEQLAIARKVQVASGQPPRYSGICRQLTAEQRLAKYQAGLKATLRFKVPAAGSVQFNDLVHQLQVFNVQDIGDFIIRRADGTASFIFCNALDDALMGVTHALRGDDHLTNTPRQVLVLQALNLAPPQYGHIPLIMGSDGSPLSKRNGSRSLKELREQGFLPLALVNYLARLGHYYESHDLLTWEQLASNFNTDALGNSPARFDLAQLTHWQKLVLAISNHEELWDWMGSDVHALVPSAEQQSFVAAIRANVCFPTEALHWAKQLYGAHLHYTAEALAVLQEAGSLFLQTASDGLEKNGANYALLCDYLKNTLGVKGKSLFLPLRVALTGEFQGPELAAIVELLGVKRAKARFDDALSLAV